MCPSEVSDIDDILVPELAEQVSFWAISDEDPQLLGEFREAFDLSLPILVDPGRKVQGQYQQTMAFPTAAYPQTYVVDAQGKLLYYNNVHDIEELRLVLEGALAE